MESSESIAPLSEEDLPEELIVAELTRPPSIRAADPDIQYWQAIVQLTIPHGSPAPILYSTGSVRVYVEPVSVASRIWRYLSLDISVSQAAVSVAFNRQFPKRNLAVSAR